MNKEEKTPLLETINLKKYFKTGSGLLHAVDSINLKLYRGETIGVVGESGCGKSTLGRTILKLIEPTSGEIIFEGKNISKLGTRGMRNLRKEMQIIFQDPYSSLDPRKTVIDIISEYMLINHIYHSKKATYNRAAELMDLVGLARRYAEAYPHELDGGRRQRIGIARALSMSPELIICDEPISALDVSIQAQVMNLLLKLQQDKGLSYIFIAHDLSMVRYISDTVAVMYLGSIMEYATNKELYENPQHPYTKALFSAIPVANPKIEKGRSRIKLEGEIPSPINSPKGCKFCTRCAYALSSRRYLKSVVQVIKWPVT